MMVWPQATAICCVRPPLTARYLSRLFTPTADSFTCGPQQRFVSPHVDATPAIFKHSIIHLLTVKMCTAAFPTGRMSMIRCVYVHGQLHVSPQQGLISLNLKNIHN